jgi:hypothetical protein
MKLLVAVLGLSLAGAAPASAAISSGPQPLAIRVQADNVEATHLPSYEPQAPIAVVVTVAKERNDQLSLVASGPAGHSLRVPLTRDANGAFNGTLSLGDQGLWRLQLASRAGALRTVTSPVMLDVESPPPSNAGPIGWAVGSAIFFVFGGGGFLLLRRLTPANSRPRSTVEPAHRPIEPAGGLAAAAAQPAYAKKHAVGLNSAISYET